MAELNSKHQNPDEDRISNLPDPLLINILSFLSSKTSVQTSILSPRWRHLWKNLSVLDLSDDSFEYVIQINSERFKHYRRFFYFVNSLIYVLKPYQVHKMRLSCTKSFTKNVMSTASINAWIRSAMGPLIKELDLTLYTIDKDNYFCQIPNISECSNLVSLSLKGALDLPPGKFTSLPSLKKLALDICDVDVASLNDFLHGCPCLETLDLYIYVGDYGRICVPPLSLPSSLKRLKIVFNKLPKRLLGDVTLLDFPTFGHLLHLHLNLFRFNSNSLISLLQICHSLEALIIQIDKEVCNNNKEEQSSLLKWAAQTNIPSCLESHLSFIKFKGYRGFIGELFFVEYILRKGRVLKTMDIVDISTNLKEKFDHLKRLSNVPRASRMCQLTFD